MQPLYNLHELTPREEKQTCEHPGGTKGSIGVISYTFLAKKIVDLHI